MPEITPGTHERPKKSPPPPPALSPDDAEEIASDTGHFPDRDQEFRVGDTSQAPSEEVGMKGAMDADEGEWGRVSDPAYNREGAMKAQRAAMGDRTVEDHPTPAARAGAGLEGLSKDELYERAKALNIPGRSRMTKIQLSTAIRAALGPA